MAAPADPAAQADLVVKVEVAVANAVGATGALQDKRDLRVLTGIRASRDKTARRAFGNRTVKLGNSDRASARKSIR
jgi:hypothetical protein